MGVGHSQLKKGDICAMPMQKLIRVDIRGETKPNNVKQLSSDQK